MFASPKHIGAAVMLAVILSTGCIEKQSVNDFKPFEVTELDACLAITIDLSGSFRGDWEKDGKAHRLFLNLIDQFFNDGIGLESRVVIGQISGGGEVVVFDRSSSEFMKKFKSPEALNQFLRARSDPTGSRVYESTGEIFKYLAAIPEVTPKTRMMAVFLSDLKDSGADQEARNKADCPMVASLNAYAAGGGGVAMYFVALDEKARWTQFMESAGFETGTYAIETELVETPQLPRFD